MEPVALLIPIANSALWLGAISVLLILVPYFARLPQMPPPLDATNKEWIKQIPSSPAFNIAVSSILEIMLFNGFHSSFKN
jgi:hypothetical protein